MLNFNHVYYFHVIAAEGSIKAAAEHLGVTQPTVSEQLRLLERSLGVELFERSPAGLKLTMAGRSASRHAATMFAAAERLIGALGQPRDSTALLLRVGISAAIASTMSSEFLIPMLMSGGARLSIHSGDFFEMLRDLRARNLDLVIGEWQPPDRTRAGLAVELVCHRRLVAIVRTDAQPEDDWHNLSLLHYGSSHSYRWEVEGYLEKEGLHPSVGGEVDDARLMLEAVLGGGTVAFLPTNAARAAIEERRVKVLGTVAPQTAGIYAIYPEGEVLQFARAAVARLIDGARAD